MNPIVMAAVILSLLAMFAWSAHRRWGLLMVGGPTHESRFDRIPERLKTVWTFAFWQKKMRYYFAAGLAHNLIFMGFVVLLLRSIMLWGRGFDPDFNLFILGPDTMPGMIYNAAKDVVAVLVILGSCVFLYYRIIRPQKRMKLGFEGILILLIIITMMATDIMYDGAAIVLNAKNATICANPGGPMADTCGRIATIIAPLGEAKPVAFHGAEPAGSAMALALQGASPETLVILAHVGFWAHSSLVLIFLNILPYSKHFHIITAVPNVFFTDLTHPGRLRPMAKSSDELMEMVGKGMESDDMHAAPIGYARIQHFTWKDVLDMYTCTECGRCSDNCPAATTGKILSPKYLTLDLRDHLYERQEEVLEKEKINRVLLDDLRPKEGEGEESEEENEETESEESEETEAKADPNAFRDLNLIPGVVHEDVLWACTTCRACEEQCPVNITYVDKIVQMRRNLVTIQGEFPAELQGPFDGMETNGNPWNLSSMDRASWTEGLDIPLAADKPDAEVFYWVGCAASYDDRAKKIARATVLLLQQAGIDFAILGTEETCTGDSARRAGNEYLFMTLAEQNVETLKGYQEQGGAKVILTTCPHCFNTLANEYPDFGAKFDVVHHTDYLMGLVAKGKLKPSKPVKGKVVYHDSCYLGRYNGVYESPRQILSGIPGVQLVEPEYWTKHKGLCCGAGGAQMWMEEQNKDRVNIKRIDQLLETGASTVASACPFCMTMLTDGIKAKEQEEKIKQLDVVELLAISCGASEEGEDKEPEAEAAE